MKDNTYYIQRVKKKMEAGLSSGGLKPEQEQSFIDQICEALLLVDDPDITKVIKTYFEDLDKLDVEFTKVYKKYTDSRYEIVKEMHEAIKKL